MLYYLSLFAILMTLAAIAAVEIRAWRAASAYAKTWPENVRTEFDFHRLQNVLKRSSVPVTREDRQFMRYEAYAAASLLLRRKTNYATPALASQRAKIRVEGVIVFGFALYLVSGSAHGAIIASCLATGVSLAVANKYYEKTAERFRAALSYAHQVSALN